MKELLCKGNYLQLVKQNNYEYVERIKGKGIVVIFAVTDDNELVLVEQFRIPVQKKCIELPAGLVGDESQFLNESFKEAALRELEEETGFFAEKIEYVCELGTTLGLSNETVQVFFAKNLIKKSEGGGTIDEAIVVHLVPLKNLTKWLSEKQSLGYVLDYKIYSLAYLYEKKNFL